MHYSKIHKQDTVNSIGGFTVTIWVSGCRNYCEGCFSKETWDFNYGQEYTKETEDSIIEYLKEDYISGLTLLGGEIMEYENVSELVKLTNRVKKEYPNKTILAWTGYVFEDIKNDKIRFELLKNIDVLVDGRYEKNLRDLNNYLGNSSNQRVIKVKESIECDNVSIYSFK